MVRSALRHLLTEKPHLEEIKCNEVENNARWFSKVLHRGVINSIIII